MKSTFPGFPEATYEISIDVTYKLRNSFEIACLLALLMTVDRSGQSEIVCVIVVVLETEESITELE